MHTIFSDGKVEIPEYADWAAANGIAWMGISDHSQSLKIARGLTEERVLEQRGRIDEVNRLYADRGVTLLHGIESDILTDGSLDYPDEFLPNFDFIVASIHSQFNLTEKEQTARMCRAAANPFTTIIGHMTGRLLLSRDPYVIDQKQVIRVAAEHGTAIEINANPHRLDLDWRLVSYALECGCRIAISPDSHSMPELDYLRYGIAMARKGWLTPDRCLNCLGTNEFLHFARNKR
jgi:DNA polymerase (family 10)